MNHLPTRVALITGCGKPEGIGAAIARALAGSGAAVMVADIEDTRRLEPAAGNDASRGLTDLVDSIRRSGGAAHATRGDVGSEVDAARMVSETLERYGRLDILVNNAAAPHGADRADIEQVPFAAWRRLMSVNLDGVFLMSRAAAAPMRRQRGGRIVNVSSAIVKYPRPHRTAYIASKAAVIGFTQALAMDLAPSGITVNCVCPGSTVTSRFHSSAQASGYTDAATALAETAKSIPLGRHGLPDDVAAAVLYLTSDGASFVTGDALYVDGGGPPANHR